MNFLIITVSGQPGAGSTTVTQLLAKKLNYKILTVGELHKQVAKKNGLAIEEYWKQQSKNPTAQKSFHNQLDALQKKAAKDNKNLIINGKLSAFQIPEAGLKVLIKASLEERARRTAKRDGGTIKAAYAAIKNREMMERKEFKKIYNFDYVADTEAYDVVVNATDKSAEEITKQLIKRVK